MKSIPFVLGAAALVTLAACDTPVGPVYDARDVRDTRLEANSLNSLNQTSVFDLPTTGSARYDGMLTAQIGGDYRGDMVGDMRMDVGFGLRNDVSGSVTNINLVDVRNLTTGPDLPDQVLQGEALRIDGNRFGSRVDATAEGRVRAVTTTNVQQRFDVDLNLAGALRDDRAIADTVSGRFDGEGVNDRGDRMTFVNGLFYAED